MTTFNPNLPFLTNTSLQKVVKETVKKKKQQPQGVKKIFCPKCGELQVKFYPWSNLFLAVGQPIPLCKKCS